MGSGKVKSGSAAAHLRRYLGAPAALGALALLLALPLPTARAAFGFESLSSVFRVDGGTAGALPAGSHPESWTTGFSFQRSGPSGEGQVEGALDDLTVEIPPGLVALPPLIQQCLRADFIADACPPAIAIGSVDLSTNEAPLNSNLFLLEPSEGQAAQLGFHSEINGEGTPYPFVIDISISPRPPYSLIASITDASQATELFGATLELEGSPGGHAFLTLPRSCASPLQTAFTAFTWQEPAVAVSGIAPEPQSLFGCDALSYSPSLEIAPTTAANASPSGLDVNFEAPDEGIASSSGRAAADTRSATLTLPSGLTINPPVAAGLVACTAAQVAAETPDAEPGQGCPEAAKLGRATVTTPLLAKPISGDVYFANPEGAATAVVTTPSGTRFGLYLVLRDRERGVLLSLPLRIDADAGTGRLTASFEEIPQLPVSRLQLHLNSGPRAPLTTPVSCGSETIAYSLTPSSGNPPLNGADSFTTSGPGCDPRFAPSLSAGTASNAAGRSSAFIFELSQSAAAPGISGLDLTLPRGLSAAFSAASICPESRVAGGTCPPPSRLGYARIALGSGPEPLWVPSGDEPDSAVYLTGAYRGAPHSLLIVVPAQVGPFDLGTVVLRAPIAIDPATGQASLRVEDLPQILAGVPLHYRSVRVVLDRRGFIRNPTSCKPSAITGIAEAADGTKVAIVSRFQAADCAALAFKPRLSVRLHGSTARGAHPAVTATLRPGKNGANLKWVVVDLPGSELLDSSRIGAICNLPVAEIDECPPGSAIARLEARTPLLSGPVRGSVFLRPSKGRLPGLAVVLGGEVELRLAGHLSSAHGRLRFGFAGLPDIPLDYLGLRVAGGRKGVLVNSGGVCSGPRRLTATLRSHAGRSFTVRPRLRARCPDRPK